MIDPAGGRAPWAVVTIDAPADAEEDLVRALCEQGALGVQTATDPAPSLPPGREILLAWFDAGRPIPDEAGLLRLCPRARGLRVLSTRAVADERWVERWIASLDPFDVGSRFRIVPVADADADVADPVPAAPPSPHGGRIPLRIVPGRAFGTGEHATTRLCLEILEGIEPAGRSLLDVGTGSGILALGALALGFARALGVDVDPEAIRVAGANAALNAAGASLELRLGEARSAEGRFDVVVANLSSGVIERCLGDLVAAVAPGGLLVLGGLLEVEAASVAERAGSAGARWKQTRAREGWACTVHEVPGA